jgi:hypothetical protein
MPSQVIVPVRPGPLVDVRPARSAAPDSDGRRGVGTTEIVLSACGVVLLFAVLAAGWPAWLSVVAISCLALGLILPAHAALTRVRQREGQLLDVSDDTVGRLVTAYRRLERTTGPGPARDAAHSAVTEVAALLNGRPPQEEELPYVALRAEAISTLADHLTGRGPLRTAPPNPTADALTRIKALLGD